MRRFLEMPSISPLRCEKCTLISALFLHSPRPIMHIPRVSPLFALCLAPAFLHAAPDNGEAVAGSKPRMSLIDPAAFGFGSPGFVTDASWIDTQDLKDQNGAVDFSEWRMIAPLGAVKRGDFLWAASLGYNLTDVGFEDIMGMEDETLHTLELQITSLWRPQGSRWSTMAFVTPGVSTDFEGISTDDVEATGLGLINYRVNDELTLAGGVFGRYETDDSMLVPAFGFIWQREPFVVQMTPPFAVIGWRASEKLTLSLSAYPSGGSWDLDGQAANRLNLSGWQTAATVMYRFTDHWALSLRAGMNVGGELELLDRDNRKLMREDLESAAFGAINVRYLF